DQVSQKRKSSVAKRRFIRHGPDDDRSPVLIARDHLAQLIASVLERPRILPLDGPVNGNLRPDHDFHPISLSNHELVVRVVSQPDEVGPQLFDPTQQGHRILATVRPSTAKWRFLVNADATQKDRSTVQQDVSTTRLNTPKPDQIGHAIRL